MKKKGGLQILIHKSVCCLVEHQGVEAIYHYCQVLYGKSFLQFAVDFITTCPSQFSALQAAIAQWRMFDEPMAEKISEAVTRSQSMS